MTTRRSWFIKPLSTSSSKEEDETDHLSRSYDLGAEPAERSPFASTSFAPLNFEISWRPTTPIKGRTPETTTTQDSFDTAPEISEPTEKLFEALFNSKKPKQSTEVTINVMAGGKEPEKQDDPMTGNSSTKKAELKLSPLQRTSLEKEKNSTNLYKCHVSIFHVTFPKRSKSFSVKSHHVPSCSVMTPSYHFVLLHLFY
jgi:hypothetical protein